MEPVVIGIIQHDGTIRTDGDSTRTPWVCDGCGSTQSYDYKKYVGDRVNNGDEPCDTNDCKGSMIAPASVPQADGDSREPGLTLPTDSAARKAIPLCTGVLDYFPAALMEVAKLSKAGNDKHNPGEDLHWARGKSNDHADCILKHMVDRGMADPEDRISHTVKVAWRALALLQMECEELRGAPRPRGAY